MGIPFLDLKKQYESIKPEIQLELNDVLDRTAYICGEKVKRFEDAFAKAHELEYCLGVSSGTDALHVALWALGIGPGDEVIVPVNTYIATSETVSITGARPIFVDCEVDSFNIDASLIGSAITPRTKAMIPVHLYGQPANINAINSQLLSLDFESRSQGVFIHRKTGQKIYVIEDCAQAHLAEYLHRDPEGKIELPGTLTGGSNIKAGQGQSYPSLQGNWKKVGGFGTAACFSFYPGKNLGAYGEAGAVETSDSSLYQKMLRLRQHGAVEKYFHEVEGHNYRMEEIQGAVLWVKLKHLEEWTEKRRRNADLYHEALEGIHEVLAPTEKEFAKHVYHLYVIRAQKRDDLQGYLKRNGVETGLHYPIPLHLQKAYEYLGHKKGQFPVAEQHAGEILSLPMFPELTQDQIGQIALLVKAFYRR